MEPEAGVDYPIQLGPLLGKRGAQAGCDEFCTLRYDFKPASAARAVQGQLDVQLNSQKVSLQMGDAAFAGKYEPSRGDGLDCVAVFDGTSFRLELLGAAVKNLRHMAGAGRNGGGAPAPGGAPPAAAPTSASLEEVAAGINLEAELAGLPAAAAAPGGAAGGAPPAAAAAAGPGLEAGMSALLEAELFRELAGAGEEGGEQQEGAAGAAAAGDDAALEAELQQQLLAELEGAPAGAEAGEQPASRGEEREQEQAAAQAPAAQQPRQPAAQLEQPALLPPAPTMAQDEMTEVERLFFGFDAPSPEPPQQQQQEEDGDGSGGEAGSEPEEEEI